MVQKILLCYAIVLLQSKSKYIHENLIIRVKCMYSWQLKWHPIRMVHIFHPAAGNWLKVFTPHPIKIVCDPQYSRWLVKCNNVTTNQNSSCFTKKRWLVEFNDVTSTLCSWWLVECIAVPSNQNRWIFRYAACDW